MEIPAYKFALAFSLLAPIPTAFAQQTPSLRIKSFSVGPDRALSYPNTKLPGLPDEHSSFLPPASSTGPYLLFGASDSGVNTNWAAAVLETTDFTTFNFASGYSPQVLESPLLFGKCSPTDNTGFDENYAAPGSVVQDPTLPPGNLIMLYEAENHCPGGVPQFPFYATTGFARSSDNGKTWPAPVIGELGGPSRHPVLQSSDPQPMVPHTYLGDAIPSGFVDKNANNEYYLYVSYTHYFVGGNGGSPQIGVARAKLGADPLNFQKWYNGAFSQPGIGGLESSVLSSACDGRSQYHSEIDYNDDLGMYLMIFVCMSGPGGVTGATWYYSTATSLDLQDWTPPQMILNSQYPAVSTCPAAAGSDVDGWYPSTLSPGAAAGHTKLTGYFFFLTGCGNGGRQFMSRAFTIVTEPNVPVITLVANAEGESPTIAPNTWVEVKGQGLSQAGDARIWQGSDFVNNQMPAQLDGVSVTVNGKAAYVYYISPTQVNVLTPPDSITGPVQVSLTYNGASASYTAPAQRTSPSFFVFDASGDIAATHADGTLLGPSTLYPGLTTPAKPGETVVLYANGFGSTTVPVVSGSVTQSGTLSPLPVIKIGGTAAMVTFAGLVLPGEYQFNVVVPATTPDGNQPVTATLNGISTQTNARITVQH
jgi:uncharacterized protein (TIGR03437 family)